MEILDYRTLSYYDIPKEKLVDETIVLVKNLSLTNLKQYKEAVDVLLIQPSPNQWKPVNIIHLAILMNDDKLLEVAKIYATL